MTTEKNTNIDCSAVLGWHVALDFNAELGGNGVSVQYTNEPLEYVVQRRQRRASDIEVFAGNMDLTSVSVNNRIFTFTPNHSRKDFIFKLSLQFGSQIKILKVWIRKLGRPTRSYG